MRLKATVAYDGSCFEGFQRQKRTDNTVTQAIERALKSVGVESEIVGSGRTDRGVHASNQVIHFDIPKFWESRSKEELRKHLNRKLHRVYFKHISIADDNFHARYDAKERVYRYVLKSNPSIFERDYISDIEIESYQKLQNALSCFVGVHNFEYFKKSGSDTKSDIREIYKAYYIQRGKYTLIYFHANGFLRSQVRLMVSASIAVANSQLSIDNLIAQLNRDSIYIRQPAPANGLYLSRVIYQIGAI